LDVAIVAEKQIGRHLKRLLLDGYAVKKWSGAFNFWSGFTGVKRGLSMMRNHLTLTVKADFVDIFRNTLDIIPIICLNNTSILIVLELPVEFCDMSKEAKRMLNFIRHVVLGIYTTSISIKLYKNITYIDLILCKNTNGTHLDGYAVKKWSGAFNFWSGFTGVKRGLLI